MKLSEGLFAGDLDGVIHPVIQIDDFVSKIDDKTLVIAFYSKNPEGADDLATFLEKAAIKEILDTEVSNGINKDGDHLVFVEIDNTENNVDKLVQIIDRIVSVASRLTDTNEWRIKNMRLLGNRLYRYKKDNVKKLLERTLP